ncbi:MAG TPA: hypothetical protein PK530_05480 [Anaerolineales bacterium]|nr:hypothetical protein [Anaerolineales bacterium]
MSLFSPSDSWLLNAIALAGASAPASLRDILAAGDYLNRAIFTWEELQTGLQRLCGAGLVQVQEQGFSLSETFRPEFARLTRQPRVAEALASVLQTLSPAEFQETQLPITRTMFEDAIRQYQDA